MDIFCYDSVWFGWDLVVDSFLICGIPACHKVKTKKRPLFHGKKDQKKTTFERKKDQTAESIPVKITLICMKHAYGNLLGIHCLNIDHHLPTLEIQLLSHWYTKSQGLAMQEEIDEFFKKIFFTIENFQKKDLLGKKKTFLMKKRPIFGSILKKVC